MHTRFALQEDLQAVLALGERAYKEARYGDRYPFNGAKLVKLFDMAMDSDSVFLIVVEHDHEVIGLVLGLVTEHFFADMTYATFMALYVAPEQRKGRVALKLLRAFEAEAARRGANEILVGNSSNIDPIRVVRLFTACGYTPIGANAVKYIGA